MDLESAEILCQVERMSVFFKQDMSHRTVVGPFIPLFVFVSQFSWLVMNEDHSSNIIN